MPFPRRHYRALLRKLIGFCALTLLLSRTFAEPWQISVWDQGYEPNPYLLHRLSYVLDGLKLTAAGDPQLLNLLNRIRLRVPLEGLEPGPPNAYALPSDQEPTIILESHFISQVGELAAAGAYLAVADQSGLGEYARARICAQLAKTDTEAKRNGAVPVFTVDIDAFPESATLKRILRKLGVHSRSAAVEVAGQMRSGILV